MENTIYIQNLDKNADVSVLCDFFRNYGKILSATMETDGKAEITFENYCSASNSVKFMNKQKIMKKKIFVSFSVENQPFKKIFVKNLDLQWDEADLVRIFGKAGTVATAKISGDKGQSNGYGFITFQTHTASEKAIKEFDGKDIEGQKLIVERFKSKSERDKIVENSIEYAETLLQNTIQKNNLFIKNLPKELTEPELKEFFNKCGDITSYKIVYDDDGNSKGYGFVCFKSVADAEKALKRTDGIILRGKRLEVNFKQDRYARQHYLNLKSRDSELKVTEYKQRSKSVAALQFHPPSVRRTLMKI